MDRSALLERFRTGYDDVIDALEGITPEELDRVPPGGWSARWIVHHLADGEIIAAARLRQLLGEDGAHLVTVDEAELARRLHYDRPVEPALALLRTLREASLQLLESLDEEEWERTGIHPKRGEYQVGRWLEVYAKHPHDHADQIRRARRGDA